MSTETIPAVRRSVTVNAPIDKAFRVFTEGFDGWWPRTHKLGPADLGEAVLERRQGGRWYERGVDGSECDWGQVLVYEPPHRLVLTWQISTEWQPEPDPARASEVHVTFTELAAGQTRVDLEHRALERHGSGATDMVAAVSGEGGWGGILDRFAEAAA